LKLLTFYFEKFLKYVGVTINDKICKRPWQPNLCLDGTQQYLGYFKTEIETSKCVNLICKKEAMKIKNPKISDKETETSSKPKQSQKTHFQ
jgi:hypothetical protein